VYATGDDGAMVAEDVEVGRCCMPAKRWTFLPFPAANRDPDMFDLAESS